MHLSGILKKDTNSNRTSQDPLPFMKRSEFQELANSRIIQLDGATGTELIKRGMPAGVCPELWVIEHPEAIASVQQAYAQAGTNIVYAPTFGANPLKLKEFGLAERTAELNTKLAKISRKSVPDILVFGDIAPTGQLVEPFGPLAFEAAVNAYKQQVSALLEGGVDGFAIETMMDLQEARAALLAVRELCDLPAIVTLTFEPNGKTLTGIDPIAALACLQALGADAFGCNCSTGPDTMAELIQQMKPYAEIPLVAKPNAGMPHLVNDRTVFDLDAEAFAVAATSLVDAGANLLGGCCGTSPEHLFALHEKIQDRSPRPIRAERQGLVASGTRFRRLAPQEPFAVIGERINPTGKKALQAELRSGSLEMVKNFAQEQAELGASLLDVNFGLSGIDETAMMRRAIAELTLTCPVPLCIDSTTPATVEVALRLYPGRALLNSISLEEDRIQKVLPLAAKYGAMLILLPLTDSGIPETLEGRIETLNKIMEHAAKYGYRPSDCAADALIMTISANQAAARLSLDFIEYCSRTLKINTVCGLSNVSFGLPARPAVNLAFLGMAVGRGLNLAIANPAAPGLADAIFAFDALSGRDERLERYLAHHSTTPTPTTTTKSNSNAPAPPKTPAEALFEAVIRGKREDALKHLDTMLNAQADPSQIVNGILIPAITEVGNRFERKEYFLPQLMQSAAAMQQAMEKLEPLLKADTGDAPQGPVFVVATVKGDIHDIGKNIVTLLLKNHHFQVIDLGKDVPAETIIATALQHQATFIGLSALMTTTMPQMRAVADLARSRGVKATIIVGGAAVDETFAESIGALYAADAMATVRLALAQNTNN